jgi:hypothetical protein
LISDGSFNALHILLLDTLADRVAKGEFERDFLDDGIQSNILQPIPGI